MKKILFILFGLFVFLPITNVFAGSEVNITKEGNAVISSVKVMQIFGSTLAARLYWGEAYVRITIKTNNNTKFFRGTGEVTTIKEISEGDLLDISGKLEPDSSTLTVLASSVKNSSVQKKQTTFSGKVVSVDLSNKKFGLETKNSGVISVFATTTTQFTKGNRTLDLAHILIGDTITKVSGDYDLSTKTLIAQTVVTYIDPNYYKPKNFEGKLQEIVGTNLPTTIKLMVGNISYVVNLKEKTTILNKNRNQVLLNRFVVGDTIRVYGAIREVDDPIIDAEIVRNISL